MLCIQIEYNSFVYFWLSTYSIWLLLHTGLSCSCCPLRDPITAPAEALCINKSQLSGCIQVLLLRRCLIQRRCTSWSDGGADGGSVGQPVSWRTGKTLLSLDLMLPTKSIHQSNLSCLMALESVKFILLKDFPLVSFAEVDTKVNQPTCLGTDDQLQKETVCARPALPQGRCCGDVPHTTFLGVQITDNLTWSLHICSTVKQRLQSCWEARDRKVWGQTDSKCTEQQQQQQQRSPRGTTGFQTTSMAGREG